MQVINLISAVFFDGNIDDVNFEVKDERYTIYNSKLKASKPLAEKVLQKLITKKAEQLNKLVLIKMKGVPKINLGNLVTIFSYQNINNKSSAIILVNDKNNRTTTLSNSYIFHVTNSNVIKIEFPKSFEL